MVGGTLSTFLFGRPSSQSLFRRCPSLATNQRNTNNNFITPSLSTLRYLFNYPFTPFAPRSVSLSHLHGTRNFCSDDGITLFIVQFFLQRSCVRNKNTCIGSDLKCFFNIVLMRLAFGDNDFLG